MQLIEPARPQPAAPLILPWDTDARPAPPRVGTIPVPPVITVALPDGKQAHLPGFLWPNPAVWDLAESPVGAGGPPIEIRRLNRKQANVYTGAWHDLGGETRPFSYTAFALCVRGQVVAVATAGTSVSASIDQSLGLNRKNTVELTRLCRSEAPEAKGVLRAMLRLWRDFLAVAYWTWEPEIEKKALIAYSLKGKKAGQIYRFDGWKRLRSCRPWHGKGTWQDGSRAGTPDALWAYWLPDGTAPADPRPSTSPSTDSNPGGASCA